MVKGLTDSAPDLNLLGKEALLWLCCSSAHPKRDRSVHEIDEQRISYVSPAYERISNQSAGEIYADAPAFMRDIHADDCPQVDAALERQREGGNTETRYRLVLDDGGNGHIHDRSFITTNASGDARRVVVIAEDVTAMTEARLQLASNAATFEPLVRDNSHGEYILGGDFALLRVSLGAGSVSASIVALTWREILSCRRSTCRPATSRAPHIFMPSGSSLVNIRRGPLGAYFGPSPRFSNVISDSLHRRSDLTGHSDRGGEEGCHPSQHGG